MAQEHGRGSDAFGISAGVALGMEHGRHWTNFQVEKWDLDQIAWTVERDYDDLRLIRPGREPLAADFARMRCLPFEVYFKEDANLITNAGWVFMVNGIAGSSVTKFSNGAVGRIGLGVTGTAAVATDTALLSVAGLSGNSWNMINAVPTVGAGGTAALILAAQFITTDANGVAIAEFAVDSGVPGSSKTVAAAIAPMLSRGAPVSPGTKTSAQTWNATVTYNFT